MITDEELRAAIAECEGSRHPTAATCVKLAAYYAILNHRLHEKGEQSMPQYSFASEPDIIPYGNSEFSHLIKDKGIARCYPIIEEAFSAMLVVDPKLYQNVMRKLRSV